MCHRRRQSEARETDSYFGPTQMVMALEVAQLRPRMFT